MPFADLVPSGDPDVGVFIAVMALGFVVGILGHLSRSPVLIVIGIVLVVGGGS